MVLGNLSYAADTAEGKSAPLTYECGQVIALNYRRLLYESKPVLPFPAIAVFEVVIHPASL